MARGFEKNAIKILKKKKNLRIIDITNYKYKRVPSIKTFDGSFLVQKKDQIIFEKQKLKCVTKLKPSNKELAEIKFAFNISKFVKSNAIIYGFFNFILMSWRISYFYNNIIFIVT